MENSTRTKDADYAREAIAMIARETKQHSARVGMCKLVEAHGNYTPEGKALWADYLAKGCPPCAS